MSLSKHVVEEAYEAIDAIERADSNAIADEFGDLLSQVIFVGVIAEQDALFRVADMIESATNKLIRRHPHVYGEVEAKTAEEVVTNWERIKLEERSSRGMVSALDGIAVALPALVRAEKLGSRARQAGMDWTDVHAVLAKVREEMDEVEGALARNDVDAAAEELGDMMLALANAPRFIGHQAEETLRRSCNKFSTRFALLERLASSRGLELTGLSAAEVESLWQEAKAIDDSDES